MNSTHNDWLKQKANLPASLAAGIIHTDQNVFSHFFSRSYATILKEDVWLKLADMARIIGEHQLPTSRVRWLFQNAYVYSATRDDGACVLVVTSRNISAEDAASLDTLLREFQTL
jgi:hypothetical protein